MPTITGLLNRFKELDTNVAIDAAMQDNVEKLNEINNEQLFDGKTSKGSNITPGYLEDPFFKTREAAQKYSDWKDRITPNPKRAKGTPNLFINGQYHDSRKVFVSGDKLVFDASAPPALDIEQKFKDINGLGGPYKQRFLIEFLGPSVKKKITNFTGLKFE